LKYNAELNLNSAGGTQLKTRSRVVVAFLIVSTLALTGCPGRTSIEKINRDPGRYVNREVTIAGRVTNSFGALGSGVYQLEDGTGQMWVFSQNLGVPSNGAKVAVTGTVGQGFSFGGRSFAVILRQSRRRY
jgi:hypothetical protein